MNTVPRSPPMSQNTQIEAKWLEIAHEAAEAAYLAEEHEGLAFDGAVTAGIRAYLSALREAPVPSDTTRLIEEYRNLVKTGAEYAASELRLAPTSAFEIYMGHFRDIGRDIEAALLASRAPVPSEEPVASKATAKICQACYGTGRGKGTSVTCSTCFGSGAVAIASPAVAPVASEAAWRVTLRPDDRSIVDKLEFTFTQKDEYAAFVKAYRAKQSAWAITDICEYQASTAESACRAALSAIPGEEQ